MFKRLRVQLTLQFMLISCLVYSILAGLGGYLLYFDLTSDLDEMLEEEAEIAFDMVKREGFAEYNHSCHDNEFHVKPSVQFFGSDRSLLAAFGAKGDEKLYTKTIETTSNDKNIRSFSKPFKQGTARSGYVQIQISTVKRDEAIQQYIETAVITIPFLLVALGASGYFFSGIAVKPVEESFELQKRFLADAGHELKTPIAVIRASCENLLDREDVGKEERNKRISRISRSITRLEKLVQDLLLLTKTEQGLVTLEYKSVDLDMVIREAMGEIGDLFEEKEEVELKLGDIEEVKVYGDRDSLYTAFSNLIKNAMIYTEVGEVKVSISQTGKKVAVVIKDTGVGISKESLEKLFDRFFRADESRTQSGNGLGLAIVKAVIDKHSGSIKVDSELKKGTTFTVSLPTI